MRPKKIDVLNIEIDDFTFEEFLDHLEQGVVFTTNVDHIIKLQSDKKFFQIYRQADYVICDSRIVLWSSSFILKKTIREQITGSDFFPAFCQHHHNNEKIKIFLLGGSEESVKLAAANINEKTNSQIIVGHYSPPFGFENDDKLNAHIIDTVNKSKATVLTVGVGAPKQEKWIMKHKHLMPEVKIFLAVGATIEFESGLLRRAPQWMSRYGLEWAFRLMKEPQRLWKRYLLEAPPFFLLLLKQRLGTYQPPWPNEVYQNADPSGDYKQSSINSR